MEKGNWIILVMGILAIALGISVYFEASSFQKKATLAEGKVVYVLGSSFKIQYVAGDSAVKIKQGSGKGHSFREGESAKIWYRTDNPDKARITDGKRGGKKIIIFGAVAVLLGIYPLFLRKKGTPATPVS